MALFDKMKFMLPKKKKSKVGISFTRKLQWMHKIKTLQFQAYKNEESA